MARSGPISPRSLDDVQRAKKRRFTQDARPYGAVEIAPVKRFDEGSKSWKAREKSLRLQLRLIVNNATAVLRALVKLPCAACRLSVEQQRYSVSSNYLSLLVPNLSIASDNASISLVFAPAYSFATALYALAAMLPCFLFTSHSSRRGERQSRYRGVRAIAPRRSAPVVVFVVVAVPLL